MKRKLILSTGLVALSCSIFAANFVNILALNTFCHQDSGKTGIVWLNDTTQTFHTAVYNSGSLKVANNISRVKHCNEHAFFHPTATELNLSEALVAECNNLNTVSESIISTLSTIGNFSGKATIEGNVLNWRTSLEENNKGFEIERSVNGIEFETVGFKRPLSINGCSNEPIYYTFLDNATADNTYYRLKQVDMDGMAEHSPIIMVNAAQASKAKKHTAEADDLSMVLSSNRTDIATLLILDESGNVVYQKNETIERGKNNIRINTYNLPSGCYVLQVKNGLGALVLTRKIVEI